jgi:hypothetical protein
MDGRRSDPAWNSRASAQKFASARVRFEQPNPAAPVVSIHQPQQIPFQH